jgi:hypothetical protein
MSFFYLGEGSFQNVEVHHDLSDCLYNFHRLLWEKRQRRPRQMNIFLRRIAVCYLAKRILLMFPLTELYLRDNQSFVTS